VITKIKYMHNNIKRNGMNGAKGRQKEEGMNKVYGRQRDVTPIG